MRGLEASLAAGSIKEFYKTVEMRNPSWSYFVLYGHRLHSLKAVVTYALRMTQPTALARDFHAADGADRLRKLKFKIVHNVGNLDNELEREWISRLARPGQADFRDALVEVYGACALSGCSTLRALEAAHVRPVSGQGASQATNGILLRADLHKLFDSDLLAIDPTSGLVAMSQECQSDYGKLLSHTRLTPPPGGPKLSDFKERWLAFESKLKSR